jgi:hypothetical protein
MNLDTLGIYLSILLTLPSPIPLDCTSGRLIPSREDENASTLDYISTFCW